MDDENRTNIITITLVGAACGKPPIIGIGVERQSHSCDLIQGSREFVVNIPNVEMISDVEYCGLVSGREVEKTSKTSFTLT
ncbi:MAG: flavin reductase, partial [Candidatus Bathyarchaeota archaeon]